MDRVICAEPHSIMSSLLSAVSFFLSVEVAHAEAFEGHPVKAQKIIHGDSDLKILHKGTRPSVDDVPASPKSETIRYGRELMVHTQPHLKKTVRNSLSLIKYRRWCLHIGFSPVDEEKYGIDSLSHRPDLWLG